ncbi:MAG: TonB-dependent receptor [Tannerella sp.]|jgi:TonB-linked SusC/RagA family outer membrane protein|nr:TonB-dependent receptor [Tannerella sp.]
MKKNIVFYRKALVAVSLMLFGSLSMSSYSSDTVKPESIMESAQSGKTITCIIQDNMGPVTGANVSIKGTTIGNISDMDGKVTLQNVPSGSVIVVSYIGYVTKEITVGESDLYEVTMVEDTQSLDEVVVVGYGTQKKANLTGAVSSVNFEDQAKSRPITTVSNALAGLSAGVQVMQTSGRPGEDGASIRIRGVGTLNNADPLVLIDGMEGVIDAVAPQDIESISILKDAAAAAIYGSRAANGVILITTKKGKSGQLSVNYSGRLSFSEPTNVIDQLTNYADYMEWVNEAFYNIGQANHFAQSTIDLWREKAQRPNDLNEHGVPNYVAYPNTDWQRTLFGDGMVHDHNISVGGGSEKVRFNLSASYLDNQGIVDNTGIKRYSLRANIDAEVTKWLTVGTNTSALQIDKDLGEFGNANNYLRQTTPGIYPIWNGQYGYPEASEESATANNILMMLNSYDGDRRESRFNTTLYSHIDFMKGLRWTFNLNYKRRIDEDRGWAVSYDRVRLSDGTIMSPASSPSVLSTSFYNYGNHSYTLENLLNYNTTIAENHDIAALAGYQEIYYYSYSNTASKKGLIDQSITTPGSATDMVSIGGDASDRASRSFFGRINYAYKSRYLFEANLRRDGHSRYHKDYRWGTFPSFSAAWRITEEDFMANTRTWLDNFKLRASYGELGNNGGDDVGNYEYQSTYGITRYPIGNVLNAGLSSTSIANSFLSWESSRTTNVGIDIGLLKNKLTIEADAFRKETTGILYRPAIYITAGNKTAPRLNIAEMSNKGFEFTLGWRDNVKDFHYSVNANFTVIENRIDKYKGELKEGWTTDANGDKVWQSNIGDASSGGNAPIVEGKMKNEFYLKSVYNGTGKGFAADGVNGGPKDGMIRTEQDMEWLNAMIAEGYTFMPNRTVAKNKIWYGDYIYADANGDGIYGSSYDNEFQGVSADPKYTFGLQFSASYKGFDMSMNWAGAAKFKRYWGPTTGYNSPSVRVGLSIPTEIAYNHYFYDPENPNHANTDINAKYGRLVAAESGYQNTETSTLYLYDGDYLKLKNLTFGYTLPQFIAKKMFTQNVRIYLSGENLLNFNSFPGQDPELSNAATYTTIRQYAFGLNITF